MLRERALWIRVTTLNSTPTKKHPVLTFFKWAIGLGIAGAVSGVALGLFAFSFVYQNLPDISALTDYKPKVPLRVYSAEGILIGEFGEERRDFVHLKDIPVFVKHAILSAEDNGFYEHSGIEFSGIVRAAVSNLISGRRGQGGSTITMQVARNFFLSSERTYTRKFYEIAMAYKIERNLTKDQILEVYLNQIYLGQRAYGFASAAQIYFGKDLSDLTVGEAATIAGLPVAPSTYNPIVNPGRATMRKNYVLNRMKTLGYIDSDTYEKEIKTPVVAKQKLSRQAVNLSDTLHAEYAAELARLLVFDTFKDQTYTRGLNVYTTIRSKDQQAAWETVQKHLIDYDRRYGFRGPTQKVDISNPATKTRVIRTVLEETPASPNLLPAVVLEADKNAIRVTIDAVNTLTLDKESLIFAGLRPKQKGRRLPKIPEAHKLFPGSVVRVSKTDKNQWTLAQPPEVQAGFISADFQTGAVRSLVGGFDFYLNMFNHVTQAIRQPGSTFKPFIYSAALDKGFNPATIINDAPIFIDPRLTGGELWEPRNYDNRFDGPMSLATALKKSKNLVSIRVMQAIGASYAQSFITKFGFLAARNPAQLTTALGAGATTPWEMVAGYSVFANGGYRVKPYLIDRVTDANGNVLMKVNNPEAGDEKIRVLDERNAFLMHTLLNGVIREGTGRRAYKTLQRPDMGGKTGTSNNSNDAWFAGYAGRITAVGWIGYDQMRPLGTHETGGGLVLPLWVDYMKAIIDEEPLFVRDQPSSVVLINGNYYYADNVEQSVRDVPLDGNLEQAERETDILRDQIF